MHSDRPVISTIHQPYSGLLKEKIIIRPHSNNFCLDIEMTVKMIKFFFFLFFLISRINDCLSQFKLYIFDKKFRLINSDVQKLNNH